jgi:glycosyltransferase involved in cell wall biosynthesis
LLDRGGDANCFAMFQDDVIAAEDLKAWCEEQLWPMSCGLVSLFTPRIHRSAAIGWKQHFPGFFRVHGGQALVFRSDILARFLSDPIVLAQMHTRRHGDDALVSGWATIRGVGIAYHTPSPTQHIGSQSSIYESGPDPLNTAEFVSETRKFHEWQSPKPHPRRIGLIGWNSDTGLGTLNRDLCRHLNVDRWIIMPCPYAETREAPQGQRCEFVSRSCSRDEIIRQFNGLDWLLFAERPFLPNMIEIAREVGLRIACVPMWEWLNPSASWIAYVDLMICPTHRTFVQLEDWKKRFGFSYDLIEIPWPVSLDRFQFRSRKQLKRVLYVNGFGGCEGFRPDGTRVNYRRKGADIVFEAASQLPQLEFDIFSMAALPPSLPHNVTVHPVPSNIEDLYRVGDVCLQPSAWEGIGLPLLECQASGLPLITTDAQPMNEYRPFRTLEVEYQEVVMLENQPILSCRPSTANLVNVLQELNGCDITDASRSARSFIESKHNWESARLILERCFAADNLACVTAD